MQCKIWDIQINIIFDSPPRNIWFFQGLIDPKSFQISLAWMLFEQPPSQFEYFWLECKYKFFPSDSDIHLVALSKVISKLENDAARKNNLRLGHWRNIKNDGSLHASSLNSCLLSYFKINIFNRKSEEASTCKHRFCVRRFPRKID